MEKRVRVKTRVKPPSPTTSAAKPVSRAQGGKSKAQEPVKKKERRLLSLLMAILVLSGAVFFKGRPAVSSTVPQSLPAAERVPLTFEVEPLPQVEVSQPVQEPVSSQQPNQVPLAPDCRCFPGAPPAPGFGSGPGQYSPCLGPNGPIWDYQTGTWRPCN